MSYLWHTFLYDPVLNALIAFYNGPGRQNLGVALIELMVVLRIFLLPLTIASIRTRKRYDELHEKIHSVEIAYKNDSVRRKEAIRILLHEYHINPWAKAGTLSIQFIALVVLYRVFVDAVKKNNFIGLYSWNHNPDFFNRTFLGFDLLGHSIFWAGLVAVVLYLELWIEQRHHRDTLTNADVVYRIVFPLAFGLVLFALPSGKSIFVLTSLLFSIMIEILRWIFRPRISEE